MSIPTCKLCKTPGVPGAAFCGACGTPYGEDPAAAAAAPSFGSQGAVGDEADLDDLFSSLPDVPAGGAPPPGFDGDGSATQLFMDAVQPEAEEWTGDDLFASAPAAAADPLGESGFGDGLAAGEAVDDLSGLFAGGGAGTGAQPSVEPGMVTNILTASTPDDGGSMDDLFGDAAAMDPDKLFQSTGTTGTQAAVAPAASADDEGLDDLFASTGTQAAVAAPQATDDALDDLFSGGAAAPAGGSQGDDGLEDLFGAGGDDLFAQTGGASTEDLFANPGAAPASGLFEGSDDDMPVFSEDQLAPPSGDFAPEALQAADALFGDAPTAEMGAVGGDDLFAAPPAGGDLFGGPDASAPESATIDISADGIGGVPTGAHEAGEDLETLFGVGTPTASGGGGFDATVPDIGPSGEAFMSAGDENIQELMRSQQDDSAPAVPGLESGDLIREAHAVADGQTDSAPPPPGIPDEDAVPPRPRDRRGGRRKAAFSTLPPEPTWLGKIGGLGGLILASGFLSLALGHHAALKDLSPVVLTTCVAILAGVIYITAYAALKIRIPVEFQSRWMALGAVGFAYTSLTWVDVASSEATLGMLLCMLFAIGSVLESGMLFLSLRIALAIIGVYGCLSLLEGAAGGVAYGDLVTRRLLEAEGLKAHMNAKQMKMLLQAFDPLFVAVNFFLPAILVLGVLEALRDLWRKWWGLCLTRLSTCAAAGVAIWLNLGLYQSMKVPNIRTLLGV